MRERERECVHELGEGQRKRERPSSRLLAECRTRLGARFHYHEMTWAKIKCWILNWRSHPGPLSWVFKIDFSSWKLVNWPAWSSFYRGLASEAVLPYSRIGYLLCRIPVWKVVHALSTQGLEETSIISKSHVYFKEIYHLNGSFLDCRNTLIVPERVCPNDLVFFIFFSHFW